MNKVRTETTQLNAFSRSRTWASVASGRVSAHIWALALLLSTLPFVHAAAQTRHALVIGIDTYLSVPVLEKARNDARAVHDALTHAGFRSELVLDADQLTLLTAINDLSGRVAPGDEVIFFFAGHGVEIDGRNFLLPADVPQALPGGEFLVTSRALALDTVLDLLRARGARVSLLIVDACRDNPFPRAGTRSLGSSRGLGRVEGAPEGTFILFSAGNGQTALDRLSDQDPDPNSVFTRILLPRLSEPGVPVHELAREVRTEVRQLARTVGHDQFPAVYDQFDGSFVLVPAAAAPAPPPPASPQTSVSTPDPCVAIVPIWNIMEQSSDPEALLAFAQTYEETCIAFSVLARNRAAELNASRGPAISRLSAPPTASEPMGDVAARVERYETQAAVSVGSVQQVPTAPESEQGGSQAPFAAPFVFARPPVTPTPAPRDEIDDVRLTQRDLNHVRVALAQYEGRVRRLEFRAASSSSLLSDEDREALARFNVSERGINAPLQSASQRLLTQELADILLRRPLRPGQPRLSSRIDEARSRNWSSFLIGSRRGSHCEASTLAQSVNPPTIAVLPELRLSIERDVGRRIDGRVIWSLAAPHQFNTTNVGDSVEAYIDGRRSFVVRGAPESGFQVLMPASPETFLRDMIRGQALELRGVDLLSGERATVTYSLIGLTAALTRAADMCGRTDIR